MSRSSPGRYALHEFAKNVYGVKATDGKGNKLEVTRLNPHQWNISGHDGTVKFAYTLFANRGDGTYSQVDETHAHLNMPATFTWARDYEHRPIEVTFDIREDLNWKIATQLKHLEGNTYYAPDLYYFLDSPVEIADFHERQEAIDGQLIKMALHTPATDAEVDEYFGKVLAIVNAQVNVFGELPKLDFNEYVFLNCFMPNASGDGMEHRNSTVVTNSKPLDEPLGETSLGTISHEFVHTWNVERIRPASLEPFDFEEANMSGELWFAEGFTSYYTGLILTRAGIRTENEYVEGLSDGINYVFNHPGRNFFNPIEMSYQAPFVDAAESVDPTNRENTFISYYTYGSVLGLALELSLRNLDGHKNLDEFMKLMWRKFGKPEVPYTNRDIEATLTEYAGKEFASGFFSKYIYDSQMPDYEKLFASVGVNFGKANPGQAGLGTNIRIEDGVGILRSNAIKGSPIYEAGIESTDVIISIGGTRLNRVNEVDQIVADYKPGDKIKVVFKRWGEEKTVEVILAENSAYKTEINNQATRSEIQNRKTWLK
ncbi:MAG: PDZ domain-containing protein, partial [Balneolaceae bacterium]